MANHSKPCGQDMFQYVLSLADSDLIRGQRLSELCSKGPELEIDIALSNIALDFIGQARLLYQYAAELSNEPTDEDKLAYFRNEREYTNNLLVERPQLNFAYTIVSQFLLDAFRRIYLTALSHSKDQQLAGIAAKGIKENAYHVRFSKDWLLRLGDGTDVSHGKTQEALDQLWPYTFDLFNLTESEIVMEDHGICGKLSEIQTEWKQTVDAVFAEAGLNIPQNQLQYTGGKKGIHTESLGYILADLQYLQRTYPGLEW